MKRLISLAILLCLLSCSDSPLPKVKLQTEFGDIVIELDTINAPVTALNFMDLIQRKDLEDATFYRVVRVDNQ